MVKRYRLGMIVLALLSAFILGACQPAAEEPLPTLLVLPSPTDTLTPTQTFTPSRTPSPFPSDTPTRTSTPTATITNTATNTPTRTFTPQPTPTSTVTSTPVDFTPTVPTPAVTSSFPLIRTFTSSSTDVAAGAQITLTWDADGDTAAIERQTPDGIVQERLDVAITGSLPVTIPNTNLNRVIYRLVVQRGTQQATQTLEVRVQLVCAQQWFFGSQFADPSAGCPTTAPLTLTGNTQLFEQGFMISLTIDGQNRVYAFVRAPGKNGLIIGDQYAFAVNQWDGTTDHCALSGKVAPAGTSAPQREFNWMACAQFGPGGLWVDVLGYATSSLETSVRTVQTESGGALYIDLPSGEVYRIVPLTQGQLTSAFRRVR
ncbi:MAG: hypothetical protein MUC99_03320 [Anaerolineae bacterium]|nr:hypothetical protein [Anaerolineae bacterium]